MTKKSAEAPEAPQQSEEARKKVLANSTAGRNTAIGQEREALLREESGEEVPERESDGSTIPIAGGEPKGDFAAVEAKEPIGAQAQPAIVSTNGTLPVNHVASPSGLVPVSAVEHDPQAAAKRAQDHLTAADKQTIRAGYEKISRNKAEMMSPGELRAVASDRGYDIGDYAGSRATRKRFLDAQSKDSAFGSDEEVPSEPVDM
jgi:hypothetical protein